MDKNSVIGLVLIGILLAGYTYFQRPSEAEIEAQQRAQDSIAALQIAQEEIETTVEVLEEQAPIAAQLPDSILQDSTYQAYQNLELQSKYGALSNAAKGEDKEIVIETDLLKLRFSNKGGVPVYAELTQFQTYDSLPLVLFDEQTANFGYNFTYPSIGQFNTNDFYFQTDAKSAKLTGDETLSISYTLAIEGNRYIKYDYLIKGNAYDLDISTTVQNAGGIFTSPSLIWEMSSKHNEKSLETERNISTIFYKELDEDRDYLSETSDDEELLEDNRVQWIAFKQNFFSAILIAETPLDKGVNLITNPYPEDVDTLAQYFEAQIPITSSGNGTILQGSLYLGPNDYRIMTPYGMELDKIINLGWGIFGWVNRFVVIPVFDLLKGTGWSYGIIILILTLIIKMVLVPLTFKNYKSSAKMRVLKPEVEEINEKYKDADAAKKQQATMELYRKTGVNPFAGCIPMLIQMPILYAMFRFFPSSIQLRQQPFLWADDLSSYDSIMSLPFTIPAYGDHVSLFTLLMCASTFVYTIFNSSQMPTQSQPGMPNMKVIMYIFPFMMLFFFNNFASGLSYYYFLANVISILQMIAIKKFFIDEDKIKLQIAENKKKKAKKGKSKFQKKLEEMAKQKGLNQ
jgi:YidC/Oxa1 family membrane protein insertase